MSKNLPSVYTRSHEVDLIAPEPVGGRLAQKVSPVPVRITTRFSGSRAISPKGKESSSWGPPPHWSSPPSVCSVICRIPFLRSSLACWYFVAYSLNLIAITILSHAIPSELDVRQVGKQLIF